MFWNMRSLRFWKRGRRWQRGRLNDSTSTGEIGIVVDSGPKLGYGHAVRCLRLATALAKRNTVVFYPLSDLCQEFISRSGFPTILASPNIVALQFPPLVISDLREVHGISVAIHRHGSRHISIHDLGLAQCHSDVAINGSITRLFPYG